MLYGQPIRGPASKFKPNLKPQQKKRSKTPSAWNVYQTANDKYKLSKVAVLRKKMAFVSRNNILSSTSPKKVAKVKGSKNNKVTTNNSNNSNDENALNGVPAQQPTSTAVERRLTELERDYNLLRDQTSKAATPTPTPTPTNNNRNDDESSDSSYGTRLSRHSERVANLEKIVSGEATMLLAEKKVVEALAAAGVEKPSSSSAAPASSSVTTTKSLSVVDAEAFDLMRQRVLELEIICSRQAATINALQTVVHAPPKQQVQVIALAASTDTNTEANTEANNEANTEAPPPPPLTHPHPQPQLQSNFDKFIGFENLTAYADETDLISNNNNNNSNNSNINSNNTNAPFKSLQNDEQFYKDLVAAKKHAEFMASGNGTRNIETEKFYEGRLREIEEVELFEEMEKEMEKDNSNNNISNSVGDANAFVPQPISMEIPVHPFSPKDKDKDKDKGKTVRFGRSPESCVEPLMSPSLLTVKKGGRGDWCAPTTANAPLRLV
ncbi:hypothetical protein ScalyP_jg7234 [Parmales sp. scaly parma]|nr:hypothetical protein ScalyP_jg7234 [Parmales sp. scaly parma]